MVKELKSLSDYNADKRAEIANYRELMRRGVPNGIACGECGTECLDTNPQITLTSNPAQKHIHCPECGWKALRIEF